MYLIWNLWILILIFATSVNKNFTKFRHYLEYHGEIWPNWSARQNHSAEVQDYWSYVMNAIDKTSEDLFGMEAGWEM